MTNQLTEIGTRLAALRESCEMEIPEVCAHLEVSEAEYIAYEKGEADFSFSFLYNAASLFGVDILDLLSGESPQLEKCTFVKKGRGYAIKRYKSYDYMHLAFTFRDKKAEPFLVTLEPKDEIPVLHSHDGQEFNYVVQGKMKFYFNNVAYEMEEGDSVYFDSSVPHAEVVWGTESTKFIAVVIK